MKKEVLIVLLPFILTFILMLPFKNQTSGDDFAYALSVKNYLETGNLHVSDWSAPSLLFLVVWGSFFSKIFGYSFSTLHLAVISLVPVLLIFVYLILKEIKLSSSKAILLTIYFFSIPYILQLSYTFLTDIPLLVLETAAIFFYFSGIKNLSTGKIIAGSVFATIAFLTRQIAIAIPFAAALAIIYRPPHKKLLGSLIASIAIPSFTLAAYFYWLSGAHNITIAQIDYTEDLKNKVLKLIPFTNITIVERLKLLSLVFHRSVTLISQGLGLFSPFLIFILFNRLKLIISKKKYLIIGFLSAVVIYGLDKLLFPKEFVLGYPAVAFRYQTPDIAWFTIWKIIMLPSIPLVMTLVLIYKNRILSKNTIFALFSFLGILILTSTTVYYWTKYVIPLLPFFLMFFGYMLKNVQLPQKFLLLLTFVLLFNSLQMTKLRYDENSLSQKIAERLKSEGIAIENIYPNLDWSWAAYYYYEKRVEDELSRVNGDKKLANFRLVTVGDYDYLILSESSLKLQGIPSNFILDEEIPLRSLLVRSRIYVYRKINS